MKNRVVIKYNDRPIGKIEFDQEEFLAGFTLNPQICQIMFIVNITLNVDNDRSCPSIWNIGGRIFSVDSTEKYYLGNFTCNHVFNAPSTDAHCELNLVLSKSELISYENWRGGKSPVFEFHFYAITSNNLEFSNYDGKKYFVPTPSWSFYQYTTVKVPLEKWIDNLKKANLKDYLLVEIPIDNRTEETAEIYKSYKKAVTSFYKGGQEGWNNCVFYGRIALEKIENYKQKLLLSPIDKKRQEIENWTKEQRIKNIIWSIRHLMHLAHHRDDVIWTRDDAILILACLSHFINYLNR